MCFKIVFLYYSDILAFVEPHLLVTDAISIPDFSVFHRLNCESIRNSEGALLLAKHEVQNNLDTSSTIYTIDKRSKGHCVIVIFHVNGMTMMMLYKSPKYPSVRFLTILESHLNCKINYPRLFLETLT